MNKTRVLYTSAEIRNTIIEMFRTSKGRRVAITAFVGKGAGAYLPKAQGVELICWPKAGGTNPQALRMLIKQGVEVSFVDSLHMKVYWTEDKGAVITSANLSTNALGSGDLRELGIFLPSNQVNIDKILSSLQMRAVSKQELTKLDKLHHDYEKRINPRSPSIQKTTFAAWYSSPFRQKWKLGWWDSFSADFSKVAKQRSMEIYGVADPNDFMSCNRGDYSPNDWILCFYLVDGKENYLKWLPVDYIVRVRKSDKEYAAAYPYQAVQVWSLNHYPAPPFQIDAKFRGAFTKAIKEFTTEKIKSLSTAHPPQRLIDMINENY